MKTATIHGTVVLILPEGAKVRAKRDIKGLDDLGLSGLTYTCTEFVKDREYTVFHTKFSFYDVPAVLSETNCVFWVEPSNFEVVSEKP